MVGKEQKEQKEQKERRDRSVGAIRSEEGAVRPAGRPAHGSAIAGLESGA